MNQNVYSVYQLNQYIKLMLEEDILLSEIFIQGEVSNFKLHTSGHMYFTLKDPYAAVNCVIFKSCAQALGFLPENGMNVVVFGRVSLYEKTGQYQFYAEDMEPWGQGGLYLAFEQMKAKLENEGLFAQSHKRRIPEYPAAVAVITSPTGAAVRDIINVALRRNRKVPLVIVPAQVQGEKASADIISAIAAVNEWGGADTIILARGGGSIEDLWPFNEEAVARAVYASKIPIVSAIGHETDYCITDFTADMRAPTPSAAAELCIPQLEAIEYALGLAGSRVNRAMTMKIGDGRERLSSLAGRIRPKAILEALYNRQIYLEQIMGHITRAMAYKTEMARLRLGKTMGEIEQLSPTAVLKRGYSLVHGPHGLKTSMEQFLPGEHIRLQLHDGVVEARVRE